MQTYKVEELLVPLSAYATVPENATVFDAVVALAKAQEAFDDDRYRHRAVLVVSAAGEVVGKLSLLDVLWALEPKYREMMDRKSLRNIGFSRTFMRSLLRDYHLFDGAMHDICRKAGQQRVNQYMHRPTEGEVIEVTATLDEAIHQMLLGHHQSLLVMQTDRIVGVLRLTDVFAAVHTEMLKCAL